MHSREFQSQGDGPMNLDIVARIERLSRQTSLAALETVLDIGVESGIASRSSSKAGLMAKAVATHVIRASIEMQQTINHTVH